MDTLLVITNLPDAESARALATKLVEQRLAACANILITRFPRSHRYQVTEPG